MIVLAFSVARRRAVRGWGAVPVSAGGGATAGARPVPFPSRAVSVASAAGAAAGATAASSAIVGCWNSMAGVIFSPACSASTPTSRL